MGSGVSSLGRAGPGSRTSSLEDRLSTLERRLAQQEALQLRVQAENDRLRRENVAMTSSAVVSRPNLQGGVGAGGAGVGDPLSERVVLLQLENQQLRGDMRELKRSMAEVVKSAGTPSASSVVVHDSPASMPERGRGAKEGPAGPLILSPVLQGVSPHFRRSLTPRRLAEDLGDGSLTPPVVMPASRYLPPSGIGGGGGEEQQEPHYFHHVLGDGTLLMGGDGNALSRIELAQGLLRGEFRGHPAGECISQCAVVPAGAGGAAEGVVLTACCISEPPDGRASGRQEGWVLGWDMATGARSVELGVKQRLRLFAATADGATVLTVGWSESEPVVRVWSVAEGRCVGALRHGTDPNNRVFDLHCPSEGGGGVVYTVARERVPLPCWVVRRWNVATCECTGEFIGHRALVECVRVGADGTLYTGGRDELAIEWDMDSCAVRTTLDAEYVSEMEVVERAPGAGAAGGSLRGGAGGTTSRGRLVTASRRGPVIRVWDLATGDCRHAMADGAAGVTSLKVVGEVAFAGTSDHAVRAWGLEHGALLQVFRAAEEGPAPPLPPPPPPASSDAPWRGRPPAAAGDSQAVAAGSAAGGIRGLSVAHGALFAGTGGDSGVLVWPLAARCVEAAGLGGGGGGGGGQLATGAAACEPSAVVRFASAGSLEALVGAGAPAPAAEVATAALLEECGGGFVRGPELVGLLVRFGADLGARTAEGLTPLLAAAAANRGEVARLLGQLGADVHHATAGGDTALHLAIASGGASAARALLQGGASLLARNAEGLTPLDLAMAGGEGPLADLCLAHANGRGVGAGAGVAGDHRGGGAGGGGGGGRERSRSRSPAGGATSMAKKVPLSALSVPLGGAAGGAAAEGHS